VLKGKEELNTITWFRSNRISHYYFIRRDDGDYDMVDTSAPIERPKIDIFLARQKKSLKRLLLTHGHPDHAGNADYLHKRYDCTVEAHDFELPYLLGEKTLKKRDYTGINPFGRIIQFGDWLFKEPQCKGVTSLQECDDYSYVPLHGHTPGSVGILHKKTKSLFLGDALINCTAIYMIPRPGLLTPYHYFSEDHEMALKSLRNLENVDFENAFFGHGDPMIGNAKEKILRFLKENKLI
jgi:glyoxylase-like metal-dependent hydrolase (beta-lactamase superfamily II)